MADCVRQYCYSREQKCCPHDDPADFAFVIHVKENAPDLLRRALSRLPVDLVMTGDYQAAERKFGLSRKMLEVCLELGFPVSVLERSPLVLRDLDLLRDINQRASSVVFFSLISAPGSPAYERVRQMENLAPRMERRCAAMEQIARAGILTGISMMPILPGLCDTDENLEATIRWTANHGGTFVLAGGLALADQLRATISFASCASASPISCHCSSGYTLPTRTDLCAVEIRTPSAGASASCASSTASRIACPARSSPATSGR